MTGAPAAGDRLATLAAWLAAGGWRAAALLAALAVALLAALLLPGAVLLLPLALACNVAGISLLALEAGPQAALRSLLLTVLLLTPLVLVGGAGLLGPALLFAWLPGLAAGLALRSARSLPLGLFVLTALAVTVVLVVNQTGLPTGEPEGRQALVDALLKLNAKLPAGELEAALDVMLQLAGGLLALVLLGTWTGGLALARSLQARLRRPGAFAQEFRALRFGRAYSLLVVAAVAAALTLRLAAGGLAVELALVLALPLLLQGLALVHAETARRGWWSRLPWAVYLMLVLATPQIGSLLVLLGLMDNWLDFRNRPLR
ncbi:hypothetical protein [Immundisolibacter cernigliae]|uniref:DUF2232 domain-containing protein n=1 Tax=Immundisolibacter cernigliae TaxID=1810504 RepID=A0A1B1YTF9_9GAMM|nr:hypothetical protein [Immundisolibacter cernigliae]ANX04055.1 hypothetical protein PG2T_07575 [Immundisolibacter cernigliae]